MDKGSLTMGLLVLMSMLTFVEVSAQNSGNSSTALSQNMVAYIVMGSIMAVIVIIIIVILIISCGRWNLGRRPSTNGGAKSTTTISRNIMLAQTSQKPRKNKKMKLKIGVKENKDFTTVDSNSSSRALYVMGGNSTLERSAETNPRSFNGPHVARVELDGRIDNPPPAQPVPQPAPQSATNTTTGVAYPSNPNVSMVGVHSGYQIQGPSNLDARPQLPAQAIYPQLGEMVRPQHQINIHAAVPSVVGQPLQQLPMHHHHQVVTQPGLYPQLVANTHAQIVPQAHSHQPAQIVTGPPAYQTMERKY